jgi:predicted permease
VLGRTITLDGQPLVVIGVLPPDFRYFRQNDVWPIMSAPTMSQSDLDRGNHVGITAVGRLKDGLTEGDARADMTRIQAELEKEYPATNSGNGAIVMSLTERFVGDITPTLRALFGAVGVLLLLACVNIANLLVARGATRAHELSVRAALGCGRFRMARQLLMESLILAGAGGALGVLVGSQLLQLFLALIPPDTPRISEVRFSAPVFGFALAASAAAVLVFGLLPALLASRARAQEALVRAGRQGQMASQRVRRALMTVEVALAFVLLVGAGLMGRTLDQMWSVDPGFEPNGLLSLRLSLEGPKWSEDRMPVFYDDLLAKAKAVPGVRSAALSIAVPLAGGEWGSVFMLDDRPVPPRAEIPSTTFCPVSAGYFETLGLRLVRGRTLTEADQRAGAQVAVVNRRFAERFWTDGNAIGKRVKQGWPEWTTPWWEIVGVVENVRENGVTNDPPIQVYLPIGRSTSRNFALIVRADGDPRSLQRPLESVVHALDANLPVFRTRTMDDLMMQNSSQQRLSLAVIGAFGVIAVLVACVGLYGVVSHGVAARTREIGLRMALGATSGNVLRIFVGEGLVTAAIGVALGVGGAWLASSYLESLLFRVNARDAATFAAVSVVLVGVALAACYLPARRAAAVSPSQTLRGEN